MCINLFPGHTYYEYSVWVLKPGMTGLGATVGVIYPWYYGPPVMAQNS
jgi:hypothetical protein